jgi:hypothetical protein
MWRGAGRIWIFLILFFAVEWLVGVFFFYLIIGLPKYTSIPILLLAGIVGISVAVIPTALEGNLLPKKDTKIETLEKGLTKLLLRLKIKLRHNYAWGIESCRQDDVLGCQEPDGWGLGLDPTTVGRHIRIMYEFCKYKIAEGRRDPKLLFYDVGRTPWDQFYLLSRYLPRRKLRKYIKNPIKTHCPNWDGRENRREVGSKADRKQPDPNLSRSRRYDNKELLESISRGDISDIPELPGEKD